MSARLTCLSNRPGYCVSAYALQVVLYSSADFLLESAHFTCAFCSATGQLSNARMRLVCNKTLARIASAALNLESFIPVPLKSYRWDLSHRLPVSQYSDYTQCALSWEWELHACSCLKLSPHARDCPPWRLLIRMNIQPECLCSSLHRSRSTQISSQRVIECKIAVHFIVFLAVDEPRCMQSGKAFKRSPATSSNSQLGSITFGFYPIFGLWT